VTWEANFDFCCSIGMKPFYLQDPSDQKCVSDLTNLTTWKYNFNYWTGGKGFRALWSWCDPARPDFQETLWEKGQPDMKGGGPDECVHLKLKKGEGAVLTDRNCSHKYVLACRV